MTRTRRSLYSLAATYLNTGVGLLSGLIATPLLFDWLGDERLGVVRMGQEWLGYALLISMGVDNALAIHFARAAAAGDREASLRAIRGGIRVYFLVSLGAIVWVLFLDAFAPMFFNFERSNLPPDSRLELLGELRTGLLLAAVGQFALIFATFKPLAEAEQRGYVSQAYLAIGALAGLIASLVFAYSGGGLAGQFAALTIPPLVAGLLLAIDTFRRYPELLRHPFGPALTGIFAVIGWMLVYQICSRLSFLSDCIIIGQVRGLEEVAAFSTTQRLILLLQTIVFGIGNASWAALADLHNRGLHEAFNHRLMQLTRIVSIIACALIVPAAVWNRDFVIAWVREPRRYAGDAVTYLTAASAMIMCVCALWGWPLLSTGRVRKVLSYFIVGFVVNITISVAASYWLGPYGPPLASFVNLSCVFLWWCPLVLQREFGTSMRKLLAAAAGPWLLAIPYAAFWALITSQVDLQTVLEGRIARMAAVSGLVGVGATGYLLLALALVVPSADRREWLGRWRRRSTATPEPLPP
jgi:O-antigen/teichoic acid export membrane protein